MTAAPARETRAGRLLIYAPVPLYRDAAGLHVEGQAVEGLRRWADNFAHVTALMPELPGPPPPGYRPVTALDPLADRLRLAPIPAAYRPDAFLRALPAGLRQIGALIDEADYLSFAIGGLFGDWGSVASLLAHRRGRPFAVWTDRVESAVLRAEQRSSNRQVALRARLYAGPTALLERMVIRRATLGLFHGQETYETYAPQARRAELVHDISLTRADHITPEALAAKIARAGEGPLQILYVGRLAPMKGPMDWLATLAALRDAGVAFEARWIGEGPSRAVVAAECARLGLEDHVRFPGFLGDRAAVLEACRAAHVLLFCHLTPESPRNLIEALVSGTPILGYADAYARDLIHPAGGGRLVPRGAVGELAGELAALAHDRVALADLITRAARDGAPFDADRVFAHRSALIRRYLGAV